MLRLERIVAGDIDAHELELKLLPQCLQPLERGFAEVAARRVVDDDLDATGRCHGSR